MVKVFKFVLFIFPILLNNLSLLEFWNLKDADEMFEKSKCGCLNLFDFCFLDTLCLSCLSQCSLVLCQQFTHSWTCSLWSVNLLILISKRAFKLLLFNLLHNVVLIKFIWIKVFLWIKRLHLDVAHKWQEGLASSRNDWGLFDDCSTFFSLSE